MKPYFSDGRIDLYLGDCREVTAWLEADVLVTDPPYGVAWESGGFSNAAAPVRERIAGDKTPAARDAVLELWGGDRRSCSGRGECRARWARRTG